jgi:hypothetical protein
MHSFGSLSAPFVLDPETVPNHSVKSAWFANADLNWCQQANSLIEKEFELTADRSSVKRFSTQQRLMKGIRPLNADFRP